MDNDPLPMRLLREYSREFPLAWRQISSMRKDRGKILPWWPDWCYCPIAGAYAIVTNGAPALIPDLLPVMVKTPPAVMAALAAWRVTKGVYRFDPDSFTEIANMPLEGNLPADIFLSLPEWCVYIETPGFICLDKEIAGFFAYLECDANDNRRELRITLLYPDLETCPIPIHLGNWTLEEAVAKVQNEAKRAANQFGFEVKDEFNQVVNECVPFINLVLYICSVNADMLERPTHPSRQTTRKGKIQTATKPHVWEVGVRVGAALRSIIAKETATNQKNSDIHASSHASPRPHYRRAHWHHYWTGPKSKPEERTLTLKWLPPIPVGIPEIDGESPDKTPAVIHHIDK